MYWAAWENAGPAGGLNSWDCRAVSIRMFLPVFWREGCRTERI